MKANTGLTFSQRVNLSPFQIEVYEATMKVPPGKVTTYKGVAAAINCKSSQAVGQALRRNPYSAAEPPVPCHRVVKSDLTLGGFCGSYKSANKKQGRLEAEGVVFSEDKGIVRVDESCVFDLN